MRGLIEESSYLLMCDLPNWLHISYLSILTSRWVYVDWLRGNILWVTWWRAMLSSCVCDLSNCSPTYFLLTYWFMILFCWGFHEEPSYSLVWPTKLPTYLFPTYQYKKLLKGGFMSIDLWVTFCFGGWGGRYIWRAKLPSCVWPTNYLPTQFLPTNSSIGWGASWPSCAWTINLPSTYLFPTYPFISWGGRGRKGKQRKGREKGAELRELTAAKWLRSRWWHSSARIMVTTSFMVASWGSCQ